MQLNALADAGASGSERAPFVRALKARFGTASIDDTLRPLPAGLQIAVKLRNRISADLPVGIRCPGLGSAVSRCWEYFGIWTTSNNQLAAANTQSS